MTLKRVLPAVLIILFNLTIAAQTSFPVTTTHYPSKPLPGVVPTMQMMAMPLIAPLFIQDERISSSLMLVNNASSEAGAIVTLYDLSGRVIAKTHVKLRAGGQHEVPLSNFLGHERDEVLGSLTVLQDDGLEGTAINAQLLISDRRNSNAVYIDEELAMPSMEGSAVLRGVADSGDGVPLLAISNISHGTQRVTIKCLRKGSPRKQAIETIPPESTFVATACSEAPVLDIESYLEQIREHGNASYTAIEITGTAEPGTLASFALSPHIHHGGTILSAVPMYDPALQHSATIIHAGIPYGAESSLPDGIYIPHVAVANFSKTAAHVKVSVYKTREKPAEEGDSTPADTEAKQLNLTLAPEQVDEIILDVSQIGSGLLNSISITSDLPNGWVQSKVVSRGDGNLFQMELLGKDLLDMDNAGGHPWTIQGDYESNLLLFNPSESRNEIQLHINVNSAVWRKRIWLAPKETRQLSINEIVRKGLKDDAGHVLPLDSPAGVVFWSSAEPGHATGRVLVSSRARGEARNFSCGYAYVVCGLNLSVFSLGVVPINSYTTYGDAGPQWCLTWGPGVCSSSTQTSGGGSASFNWSLGNTGLVGFNASSDQYVESPHFKGVHLGTTWSSVNVTGNGCGASGGGSPSPFTQTPIQHNYPKRPLAAACYITSFYDATRTTGAHHADDVIQSNGGGGGTVPPLGTPVYAMEAGTVVGAQSGQPAAPYPSCTGTSPRPTGDYVRIKADVDGYVTLYFHMTPSVSVNQHVSAGQQIGVLDSSGCQSKPHLHVGRKDPNGNSVNFTIPCTNPTPITRFDDGTIVDNDPEI